MWDVLPTLLALDRGLYLQSNVWAKPLHVRKASASWGRGSLIDSMVPNNVSLLAIAIPVSCLESNFKNANAQN